MKKDSKQNQSTEGSADWPSLLKGRAWQRQVGRAPQPAHRSPVLVVLGRVLAVQRGGSAVHAIGWGDAGALLLCHAVREVQQGPLLIGREVGGHHPWGAWRVSLRLKQEEQEEESFSRL